MGSAPWASGRPSVPIVIPDLAQYAVEPGQPARSFHQLLHGRPNPEGFHVRGYSQQGTTTTPFDMVVVSRMSRYHLALEALRRLARQFPGAGDLADHCNRQLAAHAEYIREHFQDLPEIREWAWSAPR